MIAAPFLNYEIVVWQGVITRYGCIKCFIEDGDDIRLACSKELDLYREINL